MLHTKKGGIYKELGSGWIHHRAMDILTKTASFLMLRINSVIGTRGFTLKRRSVYYKEIR